MSKLATIPGYGLAVVPDDYVPATPGAVVVAGVTPAALEARAAALVGGAPAAGDTLAELYALLSPGAGTPGWLTAWGRLVDVLVRGAITRDAAGAATSAAVVWPDGTPGVYTGTASTTVAGAVDAYTVTYTPASGTAQTVTQPPMTRNTAGAITQRPAMTVS